MAWFSDADDGFESVSTVLVLGSLVVAGVVVGFLAAWSNPYFDQEVRVLLGEEPDFTGSESIVFRESDLQGFSEVYRDSDTEFAWCLSVRGSSVDAVDYSSELRSATESNITFSCTDGVHNGAVHTHPSALATVELSEQDRRSLLGNDWMDVACVVADPVEKGVGLNPRGFACYRDAGDQGVQRLQVEVVSG